MRFDASLYQQLPPETKCLEGLLPFLAPVPDTSEDNYFCPPGELNVGLAHDRVAVALAKACPALHATCQVTGLVFRLSTAAVLVSHMASVAPIMADVRFIIAAAQKTNW